ncbi:MAG: MAPEG family protein [Pseudomonadota bacterium]
MATLQIAAIYTAVNMLILLWLGVRVVGQRRTKSISVGDGGDDLALRTIRAHANASEWMPLCLIGLFALVSLSAPAWLVHAGGGLLTLGRLMHPVGMTGGPIVFRQLGTMATWAAYVVIAGGLVWRALAL